MKFFKLITVFVGIWFVVGVFFRMSKVGVSETLKHMGDVEVYLKRRLDKYDSKDVLCAIDIDLTILQPDHPAFYVPNIRKYLSVYRSIEKQYPGLDTTLPFVYSFLVPQHFVDEGVYSLLDAFKDIRKIAFTATFSGKYLDFERLEALRYEQLKSKSISFEGNFENEDFILEECPPYRSNYPCFYKGVLCSNSEKGTTTKGSVLCAFLRKINWIPKCIVLIDDRAKNLKDVAKALKSDFPDIDFIGIEYLGAYDYCPQKITQEDFKGFWQDCFVKSSRL